MNTNNVRALESMMTSQTRNLQKHQRIVYTNKRKGGKGCKHSIAMHQNDLRANEMQRREGAHQVVVLQHGTSQRAVGRGCSGLLLSRSVGSVVVAMVCG